MKKIYTLEGLDCPHCSAKIEQETGKLNKVASSTVNLVNGTLTLEVDDGYEGNLFKEVENIVHSHEPDVIVTEGRSSYSDKSSNGDLIRIAAGAAVYAAGIILSYVLELSNYVKPAVMLTAYLILGYDIIFRAFRNIIKGRLFDENFLMTVSTAAAFAIGEYPEAAAVMLFYQIGEYFQERAVTRSRRSISELMNIRPDHAHVIRGGKTLTVSPEGVAVGESILVKPGERIPLDGVVISGKSELDMRALTGESVPKAVKQGDTVLSGSVNTEGVLTIKTEKEFGSSTAARILELTENAASRKAPSENFITTFAKYYTPIVVIFALLLAVFPPLLLGDSWTEWIKRGCVFLVISCPCALVVSIPLAFFSGIGAVSAKGVLVKGGNYLEALTNTDTMVFDKTGTLTKGSFKVSKIIRANGFSEEEILEFAAKAESFSNHPIAASILKKYGKTVNNSYISDYKEISGQGISASEKGITIIAGNEKAMDANGIEYTKCKKPGTRVYVAANGKYTGCIVISDEIKENGALAVSELKTMGLKRFVMLTGDNEQAARAIASELGIEEYYAGLLPGQKVRKLKELSGNSKRKLAFVGDGINDAPAIAGADIGIAMGALGSEAAIEAADVVLMNDDPYGLVEALRIAKNTKRIVMQNIVFSIGVKLAVLILGAAGFAGMKSAVFADVGVMMLAVLRACPQISPSSSCLHNFRHPA